MALLAINTASSQTSIALLEQGSLLAENSWQSNNDEAEKLMPEIAGMLEEEGMDFQDIREVLVVRGPGSFTGLRIGITVANTIAYLNGNWHSRKGGDLYAIDTFEYWWQAYDCENEERKGTELLVYAGSKGVYFRGAVVNLDELEEVLLENGINSVFGDIMEEQKPKSLQWIDINITFGKVMASLDLSKLKKQNIVQALYIKEPGITKGKKKILN